MNRSRRPSWFPSAPKKPPPKHGIKMKKVGTTWWGQRWTEALEHVLGGQAGRLARGRTYARAGRTHDLVVTGCKVTAKVTGSRPKPYKITIELTQLSDAAWSKAIAGMAEKAQFAAELLAGVMPKEIDEVFRAAGTSLFPATRSELKTDCSCPDWGDPCKHVAATHYVLGEALDRDPFLLFGLRGREKDQVLSALRDARSGEAPEASEARAQSERAKGRRSRVPGNESARTVAEIEIPSVKLGKLTLADYDRPREALPTLHLSFDAPITHGAVLVQLGAPTAWTGETSPSDLLAPLVRAAAEHARRIALAESPQELDEQGARAAVAGGTQKRRARGPA